MTGSADWLPTLTFAVVVITAAVEVAGCSIAACTAHSAGPAAGESVPLAAAYTRMGWITDIVMMMSGCVSVKGKVDHAPLKCRWGAHLPFRGR